MAPHTQLNVVIVGAGIGGLGASIAITNAGHTAIVLEQALDFVEVRRPSRNSQSSSY